MPQYFTRSKRTHSVIVIIYYFDNDLIIVTDFMIYMILFYNLDDTDLSFKFRIMAKLYQAS